MRNSESARRELERARSSFSSSLRLDPRLLEVGGADEAAREAEREAARGACPSRLIGVEGMPRERSNPLWSSVPSARIQTAKTRFRGLLILECVASTYPIVC